MHFLFTTYIRVLFDTLFALPLAFPHIWLKANVVYQAVYQKLVNQFPTVGSNRTAARLNHFIYAYHLNHNKK